MSDTHRNGRASFGSVLDIGTSDVAGRAFIIHNEGGGRVACGLLTLVEDNELLVVVSEDEPKEDALVAIGSSGVSGSAVVYSDPSSDYVCFAGTGMGLEPNLDASGGDCTSTNGCGAHIHSGTSCVDSASQEGHFYDAVELDTDPWLPVGYEETTAAGVGHFVGCLITGEDSFENRAFVLHNNEGGRVACGLLQSAEEDCGLFEVIWDWIVFILTFGQVRLSCV